LRNPKSNEVKILSDSEENSDLNSEIYLCL
jgi:hypothetical protein